MSSKSSDSDEKWKLFDLYTVKQVVWFLLGIAICGLFFVIQPLQFGAADALSVEGMKVLGIFFCAVCWWIGGVFPDFITALAMITAFIVVGVCKLEVAFGGFASTSIWIVIPALAIGAALGKCGLMRRMVLRILSKFKLSFKSQTLGFLLAGTVAGPIIPSAVAKVTIVEPIAHTFCKMMGYEDGSKASAGLFSAVYTSFGTLGAIFLTGTPITLIMIGLLPAAYQTNWSWLNWFFAVWPWGLVMLIVAYFAINLIYKPKVENPVNVNYIKEQCAELGKMTKHEKITACVMAFAIIMWTTQSLHGVSTAAVALISMAVLFATGVLDRKDYRTKIGWESVAFIASVLALSSIFSAAKIPEWVGASFGSFIGPIFSNVVVLVIVSCVLIILLRYVFVSQTALLTIFVVACVPFAQAAGIDPWIPGFCALVCVNVWNTMYQNTTFIAAMSSGEGMAKYKDVRLMSFVYCGGCILGCLACIPVWTFMGLC